MKKIILSILTVILFATSIYTVKSYQSLNTKADSTVEKADSPTPQVTQIPLDSQETVNSFRVEPNIINEKAKDFTLVDLEGNEVKLSDYKGKKVYVNFWATWCPPCRSEMPEIEKLYQETKDSDLVILAVEIGEPEDEVKNFVETNDLHFKVLLDSRQSASADYNITAIPASFFINEEGVIVSKKVGAMTYDEMKEYVQTLDNK